MATVLCNKYKLLILKKVIDFANDTFKLALMQPGFVFNVVSHAAYADISASELGTTYGYTVGGQALSGVSLTQDDTNNLAYAKWANASWAISSGNIAACGAILYDDTVSTPTAKPIVGYIDFNGTITTYDGANMVVANPTVGER